MIFIASLLDVQQLKGQCEASTVRGRQVGLREGRPGDASHSSLDLGDMKDPIRTRTQLVAVILLTTNKS